MDDEARARVLVVDDSALIRQIVRESLESRGHEVTWVASAEDAFKQIESRQFDLLVLDIVLPGMDGYEFCRQVRQNPQWRALPILMLTSKASVRDKLTGFDAGADDYLVKPFDPAELGARAQALLERSARTQETLAPRTAGRLVTCFGLRGGAGTSTVAANVAVALAQLLQEQVAVADFSLERASIPLFFDLVPRVNMHNLISLVEDVSSIDEKALLEHLLRHTSGVNVLAAPSNPEQDEQITPSLIVSMVQALRQSFPFVICDTSSDFRENNLVLLERADLILLLATTDIVGVKAASTTLHVLDAMSIPREKVQLVLNEIIPRSQIGAREIESTLRQPIAEVLPYGGDKLGAALNAGIPIALSEPELPAVRAMRDIAARILQRPEAEFQAMEAPSLLARVRKRLK